MKKILSPQTQTKQSSLVNKAASTSIKPSIKSISLLKKQTPLQTVKEKQIPIIQEKAKLEDKKQKEDEKKEMKKPKQKVKVIKISLSNVEQISQKMNEFYIQVKHSNCKIWLDLYTLFQNDESLLKFSIQFIKITHQINYLTWNIDGRFTDQGNAKIIGDMIGKFQNVFRLDLNINSPFFDNQGVSSLSNGLKKLKNLHILNLILPFDECKLFSAQNSERMRQSLIALPNLEIFNFDSVFEQINTQGFRMLSNLTKNICEYYDFSYDTGMREEEYLILNMNTIVDNFRNDIQNSQNLLTQVSFSPYIYDGNFIDFIKLKQKLYIRFLICCFDLPYLTQVNTFFPEEQYYSPVNEYSSIINDIANQKLKCVLSILIYQEFLSDLQLMNPKIIITDLWID